jgi:hypothetical protein
MEEELKKKKKQSVSLNNLPKMTITRKDYRKGNKKIKKIRKK